MNELKTPQYTIHTSFLEDYNVGFTTPENEYCEIKKDGRKITYRDCVDTLNKQNMIIDFLTSKIYDLDTENKVNGYFYHHSSAGYDELMAINQELEHDIKKKDDEIRELKCALYGTTEKYGHYDASVNFCEKLRIDYDKAIRKKKKAAKLIAKLINETKRLEHYIDEMKEHHKERVHDIEFSNEFYKSSFKFIQAGWNHEIQRLRGENRALQKEISYLYNERDKVIKVDNNLLWNEIAPLCENLLHIFKSLDNHSNPNVYEDCLTMLEYFVDGLHTIAYGELDED